MTIHLTKESSVVTKYMKRYSTSHVTRERERK